MSQKELNEHRKELLKLIEGLSEEELQEFISALPEEDVKWIQEQLTIFKSEPVKTKVNVVKSKSEIKGNLHSEKINLSKSEVSVIASAPQITSSESNTSANYEGIDKYGIPLGTPVNGLLPPVWKDLWKYVDKGFLKVIDCLETGNASYTSTTPRSSAYGRYQLLTTTVKEACKYNGKFGIQVDCSNWKKPSEQDKLFALWINGYVIPQLKNKGIDINIWTLWLGHNLGPANVPFMLGRSDKPFHSKTLKEINNQLSISYSDIYQAREAYKQKFKTKIEKCLGTTMINKSKETNQGIDTNSTPGVSGSQENTNSIGGSLSAPSSSGGSLSATSSSGGSSGNLNASIPEGGTPANVSYNKGGDWKYNLNPELIRLANVLFSKAGSIVKNLTIISAYRSPSYNARVGGAKRSCHLSGRALDFSTSGWTQDQICKFIRLARQIGFGGIGVYGVHPRSIHIDICAKRQWGPSYGSSSFPSVYYKCLEGTEAVASNEINNYSNLSDTSNEVHQSKLAKRKQKIKEKTLVAMNEIQTQEEPKESSSVPEFDLNQLSNIG